VQNLSHENKFDLHENEPGGTYFHMNSFARRPVLTQRQKATWKWSIIKGNKSNFNSLLDKICTKNTDDTGTQTSRSRIYLLISLVLGKVDRELVSKNRIMDCLLIP